MIIAKREALTGTLLACLLAVAGGAAIAEDFTWSSPVNRGHILTGKILRVSDNSLISPDWLISDISNADFVLLGEKHDNLDHHSLQARITEGLAAGGRGMPVAFEMIDSDRQPAIESHLKARPGDVEGLGAAVEWEKGWPEWPVYAPIARIAFMAGQRVLAANFPREKARKLARNGILGLDAEGLALGLGEAFPHPLVEAQKGEIARSHCGMLPEKALEPMALAQRARDAAMAKVLADAGRGVLIAGAGHVRRDYAVPYHLQKMAPDRKTISIAFIEVEKGLNDPRSYSAPGEAGRPAFDYLWFTPGVDENDPCEEFRKPLEKLGGSSPPR